MVPVNWPRQYPPWPINQAGLKVSAAVDFAISCPLTFGARMATIQASNQSVTAQEIQIKAVGQGITALTITAWPQHG